MQDLARREAEVRRVDTEAREAAFAALLASRPDIITSQSRWADVKPLLADEPAYAGLPAKDDRLRLFRDHVLRLERAEEDARRAAEERERGRQRELRAEFSAALRALVGDGVVTVAQGPARGWAALKAHMAAAAAAAAAGAEADGAPVAAAPAASAPPAAAPPALGWAGEAVLQQPPVRERLARLAALQAEMLRAASAPPPASVDAELQRLFQGAWDDADRLFHADRRAVRDSLDQEAREAAAAAAAASRASAEPLQPPPSSSSLQSSLQDSCVPGMSYEAWLARVTGGAAPAAGAGAAAAAPLAGDAAEAAAEAPASAPPAAAAWAARVLAVLAARPWHLRLLHAELEGKAAAAHEAEQRRVAALHDRFEELLMVRLPTRGTRQPLTYYPCSPSNQPPTAAAAAGLLLQERPRGRLLGAGRARAAPPKRLPRRAAVCARALVRRVHGPPARQGCGA